MGFVDAAFLNFIDQNCEWMSQDKEMKRLNEVDRQAPESEARGDRSGKAKHILSAAGSKTVHTASPDVLRIF